MNESRSDSAGGVGGRFKKEIYVCIQMALFAVQWELRQHCKAIILQFKKKEKRKESNIACSIALLRRGEIACAATEGTQRNYLLRGIISKQFTLCFANKTPC